MGYRVTIPHNKSKGNQKKKKMPLTNENGSNIAKVHPHSRSHPWEEVYVISYTNERNISVNNINPPLEELGN